MAKADLTAQRLRELLNYDPDTGIFTYSSPRKRITVGARAGGIGAGGYVQIGIGDGRYYGHRIAWLYMTGSFPVGDIDHINGVRHDNRWINLRDVSRQVNLQNMRSARASSTTGFLGTYYSKQIKKWCARIRSNGRVIFLGTHMTPEAAHEAYVIAKRRLHEGCTI